MASTDNIDVEDIGSLAESNPKLYEALKAHFAVAPKPTRGSFVFASNKSSKKFTLDELPPDTAEIMALFDFDGNGKVTLDEVRQGAQELKKSRKKNKIAVWAMIIQFLVYAALTAASCGVLYHFMNLMDDTTVDTSGNLMVKDGSNSNVEVSVVSHGKTYTYEATTIDSETGKEKGCISTSRASEMFDHVVEGTTMKFVDEDLDSGEVRVLAVGTDSSLWNDTVIDLGGLQLIPDADCAAALEGGDGNRLLSVEDVYESHIAARKDSVRRLSSSETSAQSRKLEKYGGYVVKPMVMDLKKNETVADLKKDETVADLKKNETRA